MSKIPGVVIGIVKSLDDPDGLGRVKLEYPWMAEESPESNWARIAAPMAGPERGFQFMPEEGDEVLVAFEQGEIRLPYIIGYLWNGEDKPPREEPSQRTIQTVSGHVLEFEDKEGEEKISLLFKGDTPSVVIDEKKVEINFQGSDPNIILENGKLTLTAAGSTIELSTSGVKITGTKIELN